MGRKAALVALHAMGLIVCLFIVTGVLGYLFMKVFGWYFPELAHDGGDGQPTAAVIGIMGALYLMDWVLWPLLGIGYIWFCIKSPHAGVVSLGLIILGCLIYRPLLWFLPLALLIGAAMIIKGWVATAGAKMLILNGAGFLFSRLPDKGTTATTHGSGGVAGTDGKSAPPPPHDQTHGSARIEEL